MYSNHIPIPHQARSVSVLALIYFVRMLGLFVILPIFALYAMHLRDATPGLMGLALGVYGLTQAVFQIPLAMLSDKINRKLIIGLGLMVFIAGSIIAALSGSIYGIILGRAIQGAAAVGSTIMALATDLTTLANRTKAMAVIGISIGVSFAMAIVLSPMLNNWIGLSGIFWLTAGLGSVCLLLLLLLPKVTQPVEKKTQLSFLSLLKVAIKNTNLLQLNLGIFILHAFLTANFVVIPLLIKQTQVAEHAWRIYLPALLVAFILISPLIKVAEKYSQLKIIFIGSIACLGLTQILFLFFHASFWTLLFALALFFTAFTFLESILPSLVSKIASRENKATALGIYSTSQFLGIFVGGSVGGWLFSFYQGRGIFVLGFLLCGFWLLTTFLSGKAILATEYLNSRITSR